MKILFILLLTTIACINLYADHYQLMSIPERYRNKIVIKCVDTMSNGKYLYYYLPNSHWNIMYLDSNENVVRCK